MTQFLSLLPHTNRILINGNAKRKLFRCVIANQFVMSQSDIAARI